MLIALAVAAAQPEAPIVLPVARVEIVVTASREPVPEALSGSAVTVIDAETIKSLNLPLAKDYLALSPSVSVSQSGPMGSQTQIRIRGAEANHSITFLDGIPVNDPASSGEFRYETLLSDGIERIEVLRGPQSALWGSEGIGGVIAVQTRRYSGANELTAEAEGGSLGTFRLGAGGVAALGKDIAFAGQASWLTSRGYDLSSTPGGDKDGYDNVTLHGRLTAEPTPNLSLALTARYAGARSDYDDFDYVAGKPLDAPLTTRARLAAVRADAEWRLFEDRWTQRFAATLTDTANINRNAGAFQNESDGGRLKFSYQSSLAAETGAAHHRLTLALDHDRERFVSIDADPTAASNQRVSRLQTSLTGEYRLDIADWFGGGVAMRRDWNNRFADDTTVRATAAVKPGGGVTLHGSYGEGVADPTFYDLFGFYPGFFIGNPNLQPERSQGWDAGVGWEGKGIGIDATWFHANLTDEIVSTFDPQTFLSGVANATGRSRRQGLELTGHATLFERLRLQASYAWLDATEQTVATGLALREVRRPRHSGAFSAIWTAGHYTLAAGATFTGSRDDTDFSTFQTVRLAPYSLVTLSGSWWVAKHVELTGRVENALDQRYQDVFAYRTPRLTVHGGVRIRL